MDLKLLPGLDHIANFINSLDTEGLTPVEVRKAIYKECITPTPGETFKSIQQWAWDTFGRASVGRTLERADEEYIELQLAVEDDEIFEEAADVIITLLNLEGVPEAIDRKMAVNRARKWKVMGDGTGYHE
jgi:hypothetical protein